MLAKEFGRRRPRRSYLKSVIRLSCWTGGIIASSLSLATYVMRGSVISKLTPDAQVRVACLSIFPAVLVCQAFKGLAYPANGVVMGGSDWTFSLLTMGFANVVATSALAALGFGGRTVSLQSIWWILAAFMLTQVVASFTRVATRTGVWKVLKANEAS